MLPYKDFTILRNGRDQRLLNLYLNLYLPFYCILPYQALHMVTCVYLAIYHFKKKFQTMLYHITLIWY